MHQGRTQGGLDAYPPVDREEYATSPTERTAHWLEGCSDGMVCGRSPAKAWGEACFGNAGRGKLHRVRPIQRHEAATQAVAKQGGTTELLRPSDEAAFCVFSGKRQPAGAQRLLMRRYTSHKVIGLQMAHVFSKGGVTVQSRGFTNTGTFCAVPRQACAFTSAQRALPKVAVTRKGGDRATLPGKVAVFAG